MAGSNLNTLVSAKKHRHNVAPPILSSANTMIQAIRKCTARMRLPFKNQNFERAKLEASVMFLRSPPAGVEASVKMDFAGLKPHPRRVMR